LDITRYTRGKIALEKEAVDLRELLTSSASAYHALAQTKHIALDVELPEEPLIIEGDRVRIEQAIRNLIHNAQKFTPEGGAITLGAEKIQDGVKISVQDTGIGMPVEEIPFIFDLHYQGSNKKKGQEAGLGIGLVLVKQIVELHGGEIVAESEGPGAGSTFTLTLPR